MSFAFYTIDNKIIHIQEKIECDQQKETIVSSKWKYEILQNIVIYRR